MPVRGGLLVLLSLSVACAPSAQATARQVPDSLLFVRRGDVYRITVDGVQTVRLTRTKAVEHSPAASPDRLLVAYSRGRDELWVMSADGSAQRRLLPARPRSVLGAATGSSSWSPDGRTLYFDRWSQPWNPHCGSIFRIGADGRGVRRVTGRRSADTSESDPAISPDGRRIAISASAYCDPGWHGRLAVVDPEGRRTNDLRKLPRVPGAAVAPSWSPDARRIAFEAWDFLDLDWSVVYVVRRDGSGLRQLTKRNMEATCPEWAPDGSQIAFAGADGLYLVNTDGSRPQRVPGTVRGDGCPSWLPRS